MHEHAGITSHLDGNEPGHHMLGDLRGYFLLTGPLSIWNLSKLFGLASSVYDCFFITEVYLQALGHQDQNIGLPQLASLITHFMENLNLQKSSHNASTLMDLERESNSSSSSGSSKSMDSLAPVPQGDTALANAILLMQDSLWYYEMASSISVGDPGYVFEVMKV